MCSTYYAKCYLSIRIDVVIYYKVMFNSQFGAKKKRSQSSLHSTGIPNWMTVYQPCLQIVVEASSAIKLKVALPWSWSQRTSSVGRKISNEHPIIASTPALTADPLPTFQARNFSVTGKESEGAFHWLDMPCMLLCSFLTQSIIEPFSKYLSTRLSCQRLGLEIKFQRERADRALPNIKMSFKPQPPHFFRRAIFFQLVRCKPLNSLPLHK